MAETEFKMKPFYPPELMEKFRQWGRKGGNMTPRSAQVKAGTISAMKRNACKPKCPICNQILPTGHPLRKKVEEALREQMKLIQQERNT